MGRAGDLIHRHLANNIAASIYLSFGLPVLFLLASDVNTRVALIVIVVLKLSWCCRNSSYYNSCGYHFHISLICLNGRAS